jgi:hypothetical protein
MESNMSWKTAIRCGLVLTVAFGITGCTDDSDNPGKLWVSASELDMSAVEGVDAPGNRLIVGNTGEGQLTFGMASSEPWLQVEADRTTLDVGASAFVYVTANVGSLDAANSPFSSVLTLTATGADDGVKTVDVTLELQPRPALKVSHGATDLTQGGTITLGASNSTADIVLTNVGSSGSAMDWVVRAPAPWLDSDAIESTTPVTAGGTATVTLQAAETQDQSWVGAVDIPLDLPRRYGHVAVWTGKRMLVWGGTDGYAIYKNGRVFQPWPAPTWTEMNMSGAPGAREGATAVWTGEEMIVWGGWNGYYAERTGHVYNPELDAWTGEISTDGAPSGRFGHTAVWTGDRMVIFGGTDNQENYRPLPDAYAYDPATDSWSALNTTNAPAARFGHTAVWADDKMIIWGGIGYVDGEAVMYNDGALWQGDTWYALPGSTYAPQARYYHSAVWTGSQMVVWGGVGLFGEELDFIPSEDGGIYDPAAQQWLGFNPAGTAVPIERWRHTAVWADRVMILWGGFQADGTITNTGNKYAPGFILTGGTHNTQVEVRAPWTEQSPVRFDVQFAP